MSKLKLQIENIITCALYVVIGILLCVMRMGVLNILMTIIGALFIAYGVYDIVKNNTVAGIIEIVIGVVIIVCGWTIATYVLLVFGILLAIKGILDMVKLVKNKNKDTMSWLSAVVTVVIGIILCIAPFAIGDIICIIVGVVFIVNGVLALFGKKLA